MDIAHILAALKVRDGGEEMEIDEEMEEYEEEEQILEEEEEEEEEGEEEDWEDYDDDDDDDEEVEEGAVTTRCLGANFKDSHPELTDEQVLKRCRVTVVLGPPKSGKTIVCRYLEGLYRMKHLKFEKKSSDIDEKKMKLSMILGSCIKIFRMDCIDTFVLDDCPQDMMEFNALDQRVNIDLAIVLPVSFDFQTNKKRKERAKVYQKETRQVIAHLKNKNLVFEIIKRGSTEEFFEDVDLAMHRTLLNACDNFPGGIPKEWTNLLLTRGDDHER
ncbi:hypothetical protein ASPZODRAFT_24118 [Penicilliopsis zonata CBS 506.65]|uniref:Uncharacterized protein n=1 Tax=Penicilliopsis zonata CBS 506.65 TaxID=1073090 RepID=A0A1L9SN05_9EURO|nr:hypothetical protein ASPZODRAFT_24118 [Penicilliopsis zonata CBS 506.65]OJJ48493.1 hypothetical protein ASPZODRAFT_24118 [Penicilliopsis zonata CBS 506.65]